MPEFIDLGSKPYEPSESSKEPPHSETYYPGIHISGSKPLNLSEEGEAIIQFRKEASGTRKRDGKTEYYCDLKVIAIKPVGSKIPDSKGPAFGESLDRAVAKREEASDDED